MCSRGAVRKSVNMQRNILRTKFVKERQTHVICPIHTSGSSTSINWSRDSSVSVVTRIRNGKQGDRGLILCRTKSCFFSTKGLYPLQNPSILLLKGFRWFFPRREKRLGREADYSPLSRAEDKNEWSRSSTCLHCVHSNNVTVTCILWVFSAVRPKLTFI